MRIVVLGVGGVGGYFGGRLAQAGNDVTFFARGATLEALRTRGLRVDSIKGDFELPAVNATDDPTSIKDAEAILVAVKAWQIREAAESIRRAVGPDTMIVPLENGMEAPDDLAAVLGRENVLGGLCGLVSFVVAPGHIRHIGVAEPLIVFGELDNRRSERADRLCETMRAAGIAADVAADIQRAMWTKFLFIAPMSGVGAITRVPVGVWRAMPETRAMSAAAIRELIDVAKERGVSLFDDAANATMQRIDALTPESTSSLQRDVIDGKPSELEAQLGAAVRMGRAARVATPLFEFMYQSLLPQERRARGEA
jgi:2-dehydropantoate 2-reductase